MLTEQKSEAGIKIRGLRRVDSQSHGHGYSFEFEAEVPGEDSDGNPTTVWLPFGPECLGDITLCSSQPGMIPVGWAELDTMEFE